MGRKIKFPNDIRCGLLSLSANCLSICGLRGLQLISSYKGKDKVFFVHAIKTLEEWFYSPTHS
jgi:hypothetical protein